MRVNLLPLALALISATAACGSSNQAGARGAPSRSPGFPFSITECILTTGGPWLHALT